MRLIDDATSVALQGSRPADALLVWAWRDGKLMVPEPLQVTSWSFTDEAGDTVKVGQRLTLTVADPDGRLGAWKFEDPLSVAGTQLRVVYRVGGAGAVNFGWFRVVGNEPVEAHDSRVLPEYGLVTPDSELAPHERQRFTTSGVVKIDAVDLTFDPDQDRFEAPESPPANATVLSEFQRLTRDYFPTVVDEGVVDVPVSRQLVFDRERLEACQDLLSRISARYRMGGDGECHVYPASNTPVFRVEPGNALVSVGRRQSVTGLYNRWVVEGKDANHGSPVRAAVSIEAGPRRWGGPHGKVPYFYQSEMIGSFDQAARYARELRAKFVETLAVSLEVEMTPHPALQGGDRIEVGCPVPDGHVAYFSGVITAIRRAGTTVPLGTSLTVSCSYGDVMAGLARTEWAKNITQERPELTWDRMPGKWGQLPDIQWDDLTT